MQLQIEELKFYNDVKAALGETPLLYAAVEGHLAAVQYLLEMGANPEIVDDSNKSPLHHVAMKGSWEAGQVLARNLMLSLVADF
ncbi:hypothetical protein C5167_026388 [Papaver somniferum]|nr:hypothetical protein C5167_026388 [Papaver somniferum]